MVRSMYSGVAGMKAHQTKMDVIGNNISNVNTYGYKAGRVSFQDVFYQTMTGSSAGSSSQGGTNPSQVGYGAKVGNIDTIQTRSTFQMTDNGMDMAIAGEGFFQVQDAEGNIFYTRAGMMRFDRAGNLVDPNGNFVLGVSGNPIGAEANKNKIQIQLPSVDPKAGSLKTNINGLGVEINATNRTTFSNIALNFVKESMNDNALGIKVNRDDIKDGALTIRVSDNETAKKYKTIEEFNEDMNKAIIEGNGGKEHPAGKINIKLTGDKATFKEPLTAAEIIGRDFEVNKGCLTVDKTQKDDPAKPNDPKLLSTLGITFDSVTAEPLFSADGEMKFAPLAYNNAGDPAKGIPADSWTVKASIGGKDYIGYVTSKSEGKVELVGGNGERIIMNHPGVKSLKDKYQTQITSTADFDPAKAETDTKTKGLGIETKFTAVASKPSKDLGLSSVSLTLTGGTEGGPQTAASLTSVSITPEGIIQGVHPELGLITIGRLDLVTFENPEGLTSTGNSYFSETNNSGKARLTEAGKRGSGKLATGSLEMSNVDLSKEFSDMIVTQRGFQANSRLITVSDEMLTELVNLKR